LVHLNEPVELPELGKFHDVVADLARPANKRLRLVDLRVVAPAQDLLQISLLFHDRAVEAGCFDLYNVFVVALRQDRYLRMEAFKR
jgi:hypothetical protein